MRVLTEREFHFVAGGLMALPPDGDGGGGGGGGGGSTGSTGGGGSGGYGGGGACITNSQAQTLENWASNVGGATFSTAGAALAAAMTDGWSVVVQAGAGGFTGYEMSEIGQYAGEQWADNASSAYDDMINLGNYISGLWDAGQAGGGEAMSWYNFSYEDACTYSGESSWEQGSW
jgi:hypothetical protein